MEGKTDGGQYWGYWFFLPLPGIQAAHHQLPSAYACTQNARQSVDVQYALIPVCSFLPPPHTEQMLYIRKEIHLQQSLFFQECNIRF